MRLLCSLESRPRARHWARSLLVSLSIAVAGCGTELSVSEDLGPYAASVDVTFGDYDYTVGIHKPTIEAHIDDKHRLDAPIGLEFVDFQFNGVYEYQSNIETRNAPTDGIGIGAYPLWPAKSVVCRSLNAAEDENGSIFEIQSKANEEDGFLEFISYSNTEVHFGDWCSWWLDPAAGPSEEKIPPGQSIVFRSHAAVAGLLVSESDAPSFIKEFAHPEAWIMTTFRDEFSDEQWKVRGAETCFVTQEYTSVHVIDPLQNRSDEDKWYVVAASKPLSQLGCK